MLSRGDSSIWRATEKTPEDVMRRTHLVTLKILNNLRARKTLMPNDVPGWMLEYITSNILPQIT